MRVFAYFAVQSIDLFRVFLTLCFIYQLMHPANIDKILWQIFYLFEKFTRFLFIFKNYIFTISTMQFSLHLAVYFIMHDK